MLHIAFSVAIFPLFLLLKWHLFVVETGSCVHRISYTLRFSDYIPVGTFDIFIYPLCISCKLEVKSRWLIMSSSIFCQEHFIGDAVHSTLYHIKDMWWCLTHSSLFTVFFILPYCILFIYLFILVMLRLTYLGYWPIPVGSDGKESAFYMEDPSSIPGLERTLGEGKGNPLQYSYQKNPMNRGAWLQATVHRDAKSVTGLSD